MAARLGHADPAVTLRVYSHVLRAHAQGVGDVFAEAFKASVSKFVSSREAQVDQASVSAGHGGGQGGVEPPIFRFSGAAHAKSSPVVRVSRAVDDRSRELLAGPVAVNIAVIRAPVRRPVLSPIKWE